MGCKSSKVNAENEVKPVMVEDRKMRDVLCILIFIAFWVGMAACAYLGLSSGDPARLTGAIDYSGSICGSNSDSCGDGIPCKAKGNVAFPRINEDLALYAKSGKTGFTDFQPFGVCRENCPNGKDDTWVCTYEAQQVLHDEYTNAPKAEVVPEIPSSDAKLVLEECLRIRQNKFGPPEWANKQLSNTETINHPSFSTAKCQYLMSNCWKLYVEERALFYRCVPIQDTNSTCASSPYLVHNNLPVETMVKNGKIVNRPSSDAQCGECIDPEFDASGNPMDPGSIECKAKQVFGKSQFVQAQENPLFSAINSWASILKEWMGDVELCATEISISGGIIAMVVGIFWLLLMRYFASTFVWLTIWVFFFSCCLITVQLFIYGGVITTTMIQDVFAEFFNATGADDAAIDASSIADDITNLDLFGTELAAQQQVYEYAGWAMLVFSVILLFMIIAMWKRIRLAIAIIKEGTKAIAAMPQILTFPIFPVILVIILSVYWVSIGMYLASAGEISALSNDAATPEDGPTVRRLLIHKPPSYLDSNRALALNETTEGLQELANVTQLALQGMGYQELLFVYHLFGFLWTNQLISAISCTTIAGAVGSWYWASEFEEEKKSKMKRSPVSKALGRAMRYHLGSLIFGSLIIAIVQLFRVMMAYLDSQTKDLQKKNVVVKILLKVVQCCLWCFEKILKYISKNAYILIAIKGCSFCTAAKDSFLLIAANVLRMGTATAVSNLMIILGRFVIVLVSSIACGAWISFTSKSPSNILVPVCTTALISWFVSGCFMDVYGLAIDTIMVCFCEDEKRNDGSAAKPYYMSKSLRKIIKKSNKISKANKDDDDDDDDDDAKGKAQVTKEASGKGKATIL